MPNNTPIPVVSALEMTVKNCENPTPFNTRKTHKKNVMLYSKEGADKAKLEAEIKICQTIFADYDYNCVFYFLRRN